MDEIRWNVVEVWERLDQFGNLHRVTPMAVGFELEIHQGPDGRVEFNAELNTKVEAVEASETWEAELLAKVEAERAEAAKWPKVSTKEIRRFSSDPHSAEPVDLQELQPKNGHRTIKIFNSGGSFVGSIQSRSPIWEGRTPRWVTKTPDDERYFSEVKYSSISDAVRYLLNSHDWKNR